ncbi:hypothetical protein C1I89_00280 [Achromobacter pulmonis]|uniref:CoA transferase n=2 Tax=Achromobacter pulmonis TaxID=1389932 RepID=A0A2N8KR21_9BURK|nr:hypothetical protein C1I89_00280 [Achromobacter pulmonis]
MRRGAAGPGAGRRRTLRHQRPARAQPRSAGRAHRAVAYSGILSALIQRSRTGAGLRVEVTMLEALTEWTAYALNFAHYGGTPPARNGVAHPAIAPYGQYLAGDGKPVIFGLQNDREWRSFCAEVLQDPALADDERYATNVQRVRNREALDARIARCFAPLSHEEVLARLDRGGIANSALNTMHEVWDHPQFAARGRWREVATPGGPIQALLPPATLSGAAAAMGAVPALGQHTAAILAELGLGDGESAG